MLLCALGSFAGPGHCQELPRRLELTRKTAIAMAAQKNLDLGVQALNTQLAETGLARTRGYYDPLFSASTNTGETSFPGETFQTRSTVGSVRLTQYLPTGGSISASSQSGYTTAESDNPAINTRDWQSSLGITVSQPLLKNFGRETTELGISLAENNLEESLQRFRFYLTDTVFSVITAYNRLFVLRGIRDSRRAALASAQQLLDRITSRRVPAPHQGIEVANAEYALSQRRKDLVDAERDVRDQEARLRYLIGMRGDTHLIPLDPPNREEPRETQNEAIEIALANRADLQQLHTSLESNRLQERVSKHQLLPNLSVTASSGLSGVAGDVGNSYSQISEGEGFWWSAGLTFNLPLGNTTAENNYRQNRIRTEQLKKQVVAATWKIQDAIEADMRALISARLQMKVADRSLESARKRLEEYNKSTLKGGRTVQDLIDAEADWFAARNSQLNAQEFFAYSVKQLWRDMGVLLDRENIHIDVAHPAELTGESRPVLAESAPSKGPMEKEQAAPSPKEKEVSLHPVAPVPEPSKIKKPPAPTPGQKAPAAPPPSPMEPTVPAPETAAPAQAAAHYTLRIGDFVVRSAMTEAMAEIRKAGLEPIISAGPRKKEPMIRLLAGAFDNLQAARKTQNALDAAGADAFILKSGSGYHVYAGSYFQREGALREQKRLRATGIETTMAPASVKVPTYELTAGDFLRPGKALEAARALKKRGLDAIIQQTSPK